MNGFIINAIQRASENMYISNICPIIWTDNILEAKVFDSFRNAKNELEDNFIFLSALIKYADITEINILEYRDNIIIGRERFL